MAFSGSGAGTVGDPYIITTVTQLQEVHTYAGGSVYWQLGNDIDASATRTWNQGTGANSGYYYGFLPMTFYGFFDGNNHKITNLYINRTTANGASGLIGGLFASMSSATVHDFVLENIDYTVQAKAGGLAGKTSTSVDVDNVHVTGSIEFVAGAATNSNGVGGMFGEADPGAQAGNTVDDCTASVSITCTTDITAINHVGGFVGTEEGTAYTYTNCQASGSIDLDMDATGASEMRIGGFCGGSTITEVHTSCVSSTEISVNVTGATLLNIGGFSGYFAGVCSKCFAYGDVSSLSEGAAHVGGFVGLSGGDNFDQCGAEGNVENYSIHATENHVGGFVGDVTGGDIDNCYAKGSVNVTAGLGQANQRLGGFAGESSITISYCYSVGEVYSSGSPTNGGGFLGLSTGSTETGCVYDNQTSGYTTDGGSATGYTTTRMKTKSTYETTEGWCGATDFDQLWYIPSFTRSPGLATSIWLSKVSDYDNFDEGVNDADSFMLGVPTTNTILWLESLESLLLGTSGDEWVVGSNKLQTPISPTNFSVKQQTTWGSANIQALKVNDVVLFVDYVKRKVRELTYSDPKYTAPDMTSLAEQITETGIVCMAHQKNPDSMLWCVLTDGSLISLVYDREQNVIAWSDHPIDGTVQSVCVTPGTSEDEVWISVTRTNGVFIEKMASRIQDAIEDSFFVDSGISTTYDTVYYSGEIVYYESSTVTYSGAAATDKIGGFGHLVGESVAVLADGVVIYDGNEADSVVDSDGVVTLSSSGTYSTIQIGLPYTAALQPMRLIQNSQSGSSMGSITRVNDLKINFLNTKGAQYGDSDSNLFDIDFTRAELEDENYITGLFSGDVPVKMSGGFSVSNPIIVSSSQPLPMTVRAIIASVDVTGK